jgi:hypothetical protein
MSLCSGLVVCQCPPCRLNLWWLTISLFLFPVWQPEVAQRAYDATMLPHILQVCYCPDNRTDALFSLLPVPHRHEFLEFFQHMCDDTDHGWLQLRNLQNTLPISRYKHHGILICCLWVLNPDQPLTLPDIKPLADLRPAYNLEAIVKIHRSLSSTLSSMVAQQGTQGDIPGTSLTNSSFSMLSEYQAQLFC